MPALDTPAAAMDTRRPEPGRERPMPLFRVYKMRRRDRRGRPWLLWWEDPPDGGATRTKSIGPMSEHHAEDHRILWQIELNGLRGDDGEGHTRWSDFERGYLEAAAVDLSRPSLAIARQTLKRFREAVRPRLLDQVDRVMIERYRVGRLASVSQTTVRKDLATLRAAFSWAVELGHVVSNPFDRITRRGRLQRADPDALTAGQTEAFLTALKEQPTWIQASLRLACLWGPRAGELAAIRRSDIDFAARTIRIPVAARRTTKEGRGKTLPVDDETLGLVQELSHRDCPVLWGPLDRPFTTGGGRGGYTRTLGERCRAILAGLGVEPRDDHPLQFLRRTAETNMRRRGVPDWMIGAILGHGTRVGEACYNGMTADEVASQVAEMIHSAKQKEVSNALDSQTWPTS